MPPRSTSFLVCFIYRRLKTMVRTDREIVSNTENSLCLGSDVYVLGDVNIDLMKGTNYALYNDLVMLGSYTTRIKFLSRSRVRKQPFKRADIFCGVHRPIRSLSSGRC